MVEAWIWLNVQLSVCWHAGHPVACRGSRALISLDVQLVVDWHAGGAVARGSRPGIADALATVARRSADGAVKMLKMRMVGYYCYDDQLLEGQTGRQRWKDGEREWVCACYKREKDRNERSGSYHIILEHGLRTLSANPSMLHLNKILIRTCELNQ